MPEAGRHTKPTQNGRQQPTPSASGSSLISPPRLLLINNKSFTNVSSCKEPGRYTGILSLPVRKGLLLISFACVFNKDNVSCCCWSNGVLFNRNADTSSCCWSNGSLGDRAVLLFCCTFTSRLSSLLFNKISSSAQENSKFCKQTMLIDYQKRKRS